MRLQLRALVNPHAVGVVLFLLLFTLAVRHLRSSAWHDPGSLFFSPNRAFERHYSQQRQREANDFVEVASRKTARPVAKASSKHAFCVGILPTDPAQDIRQFRQSVGSLLEGLAEVERKDIYLLSFDVNVDPDAHSNQPWLSRLSDAILTYSDISPDQAESMMELQMKDIYATQKPIVDYARLLDACHATDAPYTLILEDGIIAMDGWYHRTRAAAAALEQRPDATRTLDLRLFYNEHGHTWHASHLFHYLAGALAANALLAAALSLLRRTSPPAARFLTPRASTLILAACGPLCIALFFAAGRLTLLPPHPGLARLAPTDALGSHALLFPREAVAPLSAYLDGRRYGLIDHLLEDYAAATGLQRYALTPSLFQHVPAPTRRVGRRGLGREEQVAWNWSFEAYNATLLREEHLAALNSSGAA